MHIGQLARQAGVAVDTVRYYEKQGVLPPAARRASGYRSYDAEDVARLRFIRRAKTLGFTLDEIRDLLRISAHRNEDMAELKSTAEEKLVLIEQRLAELARMRDALHQLIDACPGHGALDRCPILAALAEETR